MGFHGPAEIGRALMEAGLELRLPRKSSHSLEKLCFGGEVGQERTESKEMSESCPTLSRNAPNLSWIWGLASFWLSAKEPSGPEVGCHEPWLIRRLGDLPGGTIPSLL